MTFAARLTDTTSHGGAPVTGSVGSPNVLIGIQGVAFVVSLQPTNPNQLASGDLLGFVWLGDGEQV